MNDIKTWLADGEPDNPNPLEPLRIPNSFADVNPHHLESKALVLFLLAGGTMDQLYDHRRKTWRPDSCVLVLRVFDEKLDSRVTLLCISALSRIESRAKHNCKRTEIESEVGQAE
jgi:hypothetical protein